MEGEIKRFITVWIIVFVSLFYCHTIAKYIPYGKTRLFAILPIICLFIYIHLFLNSIHLGATSAFLIVWLSSFKLILFAFGKPPLSSYPPLNLPSFILFSTLPIKIQQYSQSNIVKRSHFSIDSLFTSSTTTFVTKFILLAIFIQIYNYKDFVHPKAILVLYCFHVYLCLEIFLAFLAAVARAVARVDFEPQFDEPYLSTSLQDFWGRRWNLMVTNILRPTVYDPVRLFSSLLIGRRWASLPATLVTFFVSGVMHELILYYVGRMKPSFELTWFFMIHGVCLATEIGIKKALKGKFNMPSFVSRPLVIMFVLSTALWLFFPPILRCNADLKAKRETAAIAEFVKWCFSGIFILDLLKLRTDDKLWSNNVHHMTTRAVNELKRAKHGLVCLRLVWC